MLHDDPADAELLAYCDGLRAMIAREAVFGEPVRVLLDSKPGKAAAKRWDWVRKGAPVIIEVGGRDMEAGNVTLLRRDQLWGANAKPNFAVADREAAARSLPVLLAEIQQALFVEAQERRESNIERGITRFEELEGFFAEAKRYPGWVEVQWSRPFGAELGKVVERVKALKLTFRNVPIGAAPVDGTCLFTGAPAVERILVARAY